MNPSKLLIILPHKNLRLPALLSALLLVGVLLLTLPASVRAEEKKAAAKLDSNQRTFFENKIRPVLVEHCYSCHSASSKELGGKLLLDSRQGMIKGGESGPSFITGDAAQSLLIQALKHDGVEMPPEKPLPEAVVNNFIEWIKMGAPDPRVDKVNLPDGEVVKKVTENAENALWSFQPIKNPKVPQVKRTNWSSQPIDLFVLAKMEASGLSPNVSAPPAVLLRRLYYDLTGLAPTKKQIDLFVKDFSQHGDLATEKVVDQLLASAQYGEHWGRHWLDVARYGESNGNDGLGRNPTSPHAWRYRDYVIDAFNKDVPYDQFLHEQLAGDLLPSDSPEEHDRHLVATGFLALASKPAKAMNENFHMDIVADQIDVIGTGIMGISVACARCHDHKFDPIPTRDYYALAGMFTSTETMWGMAGYEKLTAPKTDLHVLNATPKVLPPEGFVETVLVIESATGIPKPIPKSKWEPGTPLAMGVRDIKKPADCKVNIKGDAKKLGEVVPRGFLSACAVGLPKSIDVNPAQSGRLQLAQWITQAKHPLTSRVMVNRIWLHLFGAGIVRTPDDFGVYGERPSHPQLLDHLATQFVKEGWSTKQLIRTIVLSRTYQLDSQATADLIRSDSQNILLTRHSRRRLNAEALRDSMLQASGQLDLQPGEGSLVRHRPILINLAGSLHQPSNKRSVYLCYLRSSLPPTLVDFNLPDFTSVTGKRDISTIPSQALHLYNSPFVTEQAGFFAQRVTETSSNENARIQFAYLTALNRKPTPEELQQALDLIRYTKSDTKSETKAWASLCQALLSTNEFRYID